MDSFLYLQNVSITNYAALSSSIFICSIYSAWDHTPPIDVIWQKAPQPTFDASECIKSSTWLEITNLPFDSLMFDIHQFSSSLQSGSRATLLL